MDEMLRLENISKHFSGLKAVDGLDLSVKKGSIHGLIGPNGAGKTTLFSLISGIEKPTSGRVVFDGEDVTGLKPYVLCKKGIARTYQIVKPFKGMTVLDNTMIGAYVHTDRTDVARNEGFSALEAVHLENKANDIAGGLNLCEQKRLEVARSLASNPKLLLLDEVMAGLNPVELNEVLDIIVEINKRGISIVVVEHIMHAIMTLSQEITVMSFGKKIAEGNPESISKNPEVISAYLGTEFAEKDA